MQHLVNFGLILLLRTKFSLAVTAWRAGPAHTARYVNTYTGRYDGVHLFGETARADYTNSIKSILLLALPENQPTNVFGTAQDDGHHRRTKYQPNLQTSNRFSVFNSNNMGNFWGVGIPPPPTPVL